MANEKKAPHSNQWIGTLIAGVIVLVIAITNDLLWYKIVGIVFAVVAVGYSAWLFRREWLWYHRPSEG
jgi:hypothetical protein